MRLLVLVLLLPTAHAGPLIVGVVAHTPEGVGDAVAIASDEPWSLTGYSLTDGESHWIFPDNATVHGPAWVVADDETWLSHGQGPPRWSWPSLRLANGGDQVKLLDPTGNMVDAFAYGSAQVESMAGSIQLTSPSVVYQRQHDGRWVDTDSASDWVSPRIHRVGQTALDQPTWRANVTLYALPDAGYQVLRGLMMEATPRLHLHVYELRAAHLVDGLVEAARRGVDVQVLLDGNPIGSDAWEKRHRAEAIVRLEEAGARVVTSGEGRFRFHHLKILVADNNVAVQSENWVDSGVPLDATWGNRGWGAVVHSAPAADWFAAWMTDDRGAWDAKPANWQSLSPWHEAPPRLAPASSNYRPVAPLRIGDATVQPWISPDHTSDQAWVEELGPERRLWAQQLDLALWEANALGWSGPDRLATALATSAQAGRDVRVMAAAPFHAQDTGNQEALAWLASAGARVQQWDHPELGILHNKGLIVDDSVFLGSMNGNHHSRSNNREVSLRIHDERAAQYFAALFVADWAPEPGRDWGVIGHDVRSIPATPVPMLLVALFFVATRRC